MATENAPYPSSEQLNLLAKAEVDGDVTKEEYQLYRGTLTREQKLDLDIYHFSYGVDRITESLTPIINDLRRKASQE